MERLSQILLFTSFLAPLVSFTGVYLIRDRHPRIIGSWAFICMSVAFITALLLTIQRWHMSSSVIEIEWFSVGVNSFDADLAISRQSLLMLTVVAFVSLLVHLYSTVYMRGDRDWKRYFAMLGFFTFSMQGIVLSDNLLFLFIFWELVGFCSYMLIGHWSHKIEAGRAASKAFVLNRVGDIGFLVGLMIIWTTQNSFSLSALPGAGMSEWQTAAALCIFCGIIGKSAQFPLFTWLPDAMEGPTPVSALIHAATMVAAGVYLLIRIFDVFTADAMVVVAWTGAITAIVGSVAALSQYDIKKVLAYSTMSQLGLMVLALGMGAVDAAFLHLLTHAFFKAGLFLAAGIVIHTLHEAQEPDRNFDVQDIRNMGGLRTRMPITFFAFTISAASLAGIPFFSGFLSKEAILITLFSNNNMNSWVMGAIVFGVSFLTVVYTFRLVWFTFISERMVKTRYVTDPEWRMLLPVGLLAVCSLWFVVSLNPFDSGGWPIPPPEASGSSLWITLFSSMWIVMAMLVSWFIFRKGRPKANAVLRNAFYIDRFYRSFFGNIIRLSGSAAAKLDSRGIDRTIHAFAYAQVITAHMTGWIDRTFVDGTVNAIARLTGTGGKMTRSLQGGNIQLYIFWSVFAIIIFIIWTIK